MTSRVAEIKPRRKAGVRTKGSRGESLRLRDQTIAQVIERIAAGFPYEFLVRFQRATQLPLERVAEIVRIPMPTLSRRKSEGKLRADESERLFRASTVLDRAVDLFEGNGPAAMRWLTTPQPALGGREPLEFSRTDLGAREVEDLIGRLEHGVFT